MVDAVPLAGPGREGAHADREPGAMRTPLPFPLPASEPCPMAAAGVGRDHERPRGRLRRPPQAVPPAPDRMHREAGRVRIDPDAAPSVIAVEIVDAVREGVPVPGIRDHEVMHAPALRRPVRAPRPAAIRAIATQFLLLRLHRNCRVLPSVRPLDGVGDVPELRIAIRLLPPFARRHGALEAVAPLVQQCGDDGVADVVPERRRRDGPRADALTGPAPRRVRITGRGRLHQRVQIAQPGGVARGDAVPAPARFARPSRLERGVRLELPPPSLDRGARDPVARSTSAIPPCPIARASVAAQMRRDRSVNRAASPAGVARRVATGTARPSHADRSGTSDIYSVIV